MSDCSGCIHFTCEQDEFPCIDCNRAWSNSDKDRFMNETDCYNNVNSPTQIKDCIREICQEIENLLVEKNESYGSAVFDPVKIFSKTDALEQVNVRIDDKLSRIMRGNEYGQEDTELDLIGYLILKRAVKKYMLEEL